MDSNFGTLLTVWDRIFRTMRRPESDAGWFGLPGVERETAMSLTSLLGLPFRPPTSQGRAEGAG
jgi:sterol desaturase/sphingolipid hydroxylase (fatty acid hydroxylase superfamily)